MVDVVRLNRHKLSNTQIDQLFTQLSSLLSHSSEQNVHLLFDKLLGPEEKIMLAKRLAIIVMLEQGYSYNQIADALHISPSTAANLSDRLYDGDVKKIIALIEKEPSIFANIATVLDSILTAGGIMPYYGETHKSMTYKKQKGSH